MAIKEANSRLLLEEDVIKAVDQHMNDDDGTLDDDISCILEEINSISIIGSKEALENIEVNYKEELDFSKPIINGIYNQGTVSITTPKVFIFKTHEKNFMKVQEYLKKCIQEGCLVIPDDVEFVGIEDSYNERKIEG